MKTIVKMKFGSHVYGTNIPESDLDLKSIYLPSSRDIVLSKGQRTINNHSETEDHELIPLREFLNQAQAGQTYALDMLFTPDQHILESSPEWEFIVQNRNKLISQNLKPYLGYAKAQALKYSLKGERLESVCDLIKQLEYLAETGHHNRVLFDVIQYLQETIQNPYFRVKKIKGANEQLEEHIEICGKFIPVTATIEYALNFLYKMRSKYGDRAKDAMENKGLNWKALCHAVRVCQQAKELLKTGYVTFPRPDAEYLLQIRKGEREYIEISQYINLLNSEIDVLQITTELPKEPDKQFWDDFVYEVYTKEIRENK